MKWKRMDFIYFFFKKKFLDIISNFLIYQTDVKIKFQIIQNKNLCTVYNNQYSVNISHNYKYLMYYKNLVPTTNSKYRFSYLSYPKQKPK